MNEFPKTCLRRTTGGALLCLALGSAAVTGCGGGSGDEPEPSSEATFVSEVTYRNAAEPVCAVAFAMLRIQDDQNLEETRQEMKGMHGENGQLLKYPYGVYKKNLEGGRQVGATAILDTEIAGLEAIEAPTEKYDEALDLIEDLKQRLERVYESPRTWRDVISRPSPLAEELGLRICGQSPYEKSRQ